jgi:hypothetical protein
MDDLNMATASLKLPRAPTPAAASEDPNLVTTLTAVFATIFLMALALVATCLVASKSEGTDNRRSLAAFLIYALSGMSPEPEQARGKDKQRRQSLVDGRRVFSLDSKLEPQSMNADASRRRRSSRYCLDNTLMMGTLDHPIPDAYSVSPGMRKTDSPFGRCSPHSNSGSPGSANSYGPLRQPDNWRSRSPRSPGPNAYDLEMARLMRRLDEERDRVVDLQAKLGPETTVDDKFQHARRFASRPSGRKPSVARLKELDLMHSRGRRLLDFDLDAEVLDEWDDDSEWEFEDRAARPASGDPMDGEDVGCPPTRELRLPKPAVAPQRVTVIGRSVLKVDYDIPTGSGPVVEESRSNNPLRRNNEGWGDDGAKGLHPKGRSKNGGTKRVPAKR